MASHPPPEDPIDLQTTKKRNSKGPVTRPSRDSLASIGGSRRRLGLILFVLILDLGLAIAGAVMLAEGLSASSEPSEGSASSSATTSESTLRPAAALPAAAAAPAPAAPPPAAVQQPVAATGSAALTTAIGSAVEPVKDKDKDKDKDKARQSRKKKSGKGSNGAPVDPYDGSGAPPPPSPPPPSSPPPEQPLPPAPATPP